MVTVRAVQVGTIAIVLQAFILPIAGYANHLIGLPDLLELARHAPQQISMSADGRDVALAVGEGRTTIEVSLAANATPIQLGEGFSPSWAPNSRLLSFYSARSGTVQLWVWNKVDRRLAQITNFVNGVDPDPSTRLSGPPTRAFRSSWSPDSTRIVFASRSPETSAAALGSSELELPPDTAAPLVLTNSTPDEWALRDVFANSRYLGGVKQSKLRGSTLFRQGVNAFNQLFVADVVNATYRQVTTGKVSRFHPDWAPVDDRIVFVMVEGLGAPPEIATAAIATLDLDKETQDQVTTTQGIHSWPTWSPDGQRIAYLRTAQRFSQQRIHISMKAGDKPLDATPQLDRHITDFQWSRGADEAIYFVYRDGQATPLARIKPGNESVEPIANFEQKNSYIAGFSAPTSDSIGWIELDPVSVWRVRRNGRPRATPITVRQASVANSIASLLNLRSLSWVNSRGDRLDGTLLLPKTASRIKPVPLIMDVYPAKAGADWTRPLSSNYALVAQGYAVFRSTLRAPHAWMNQGLNEQWSLDAKGPRGWAATTDDVMSALRVLTQQPEVDTRRTCLFGFSNGGTVAHYLVAHTNRFKCAVVISPALSNWVRRMMLGTAKVTSWFYDGHTLPASLQDFIDLSPTFQSSKIRTPLLLAVGDQDVDAVLDSLEVYNSLRATGTDVTLVRYPDQGHVLAGEALNDLWGKILGFYGRHLQATDPQP